MPTLQVKVEDRLLAVLRKKARAIGLTQAEYVTRWLEGLAGAGGATTENPVLGAEGAGSNEVPAVGTAEPVMGSTTPAGLSSEELVVLGRRQVELLEQLVAIAEKPVIPAAGAGSVVVGDEPVKAAEVVITPPAPEQPEQSGEQGPVHTTEQVAVAAPADVQGGAELLAAQRARQRQELEKWTVQQGAAVQAANEVARREALAAAGQVVADAAPVAVEEKKAGSSAFAQQLKAAAEAAAAQAAEAPGMGGNQVDAEEEAASMPAMSEPAVITPADACELVLEVEAAPVDPAGDDLEARVAAMEALDRAMEEWLQAIRDGGDPVAPPLPADASDQDWQDAAEAAVEARGKKPLPELTAAALKYWGRD